MATLPDAARAVVDSAALAHLATVDADGSPQASVVWAGTDGEEVVMASLGRRRKLDNIERDPRVVITMETDRVGPGGLTEYLIIHGRARVEAGGAPELLQRLARTYLGPDVVFPAMEDPPPGYVVRVSVDRVGGVGPWARP